MTSWSTARFSAALLICFSTSVMPATAGELRAGAAMSNITPKMGVPLDGTILQIGPAKHVHDELWVRCLVLDDGTTKLAFAQVDNTMISRELHDAAKNMIKQRTGIPADRFAGSARRTKSPRAPRCPSCDRGTTGPAGHQCDHPNRSTC